LAARKQGEAVIETNPHEALTALEMLAMPLFRMYVNIGAIKEQRSEGERRP
jgi:hypothetical protein